MTCSRHGLHPPVASIALAALALFVCVVPSESATLHVAADGSAPYGDLASAAAAAASGDTIRIAGGEYPHVASYTLDNGLTLQAVVLIEVSELTILGESRDTVILGPEAPMPNMEHAPSGLSQIPGTAVRLVVRGVTVRNTKFGVSLFADGEVSDSRFMHNFDGVNNLGAGHTLVTRTELLDNTSRGIISFQSASASSIVVADCTFQNNLVGADFQSRDSMLERCTILGGRVGMQVSLGGSATIRDCTFVDNEFVGAATPSGCSTILRDNVFVGQASTNLFNDGSITGSGNTLSGGTFTTIQFAPRALFDFHNNHILNAGGYSAWMPTGGTDPVIPIDLTNNHCGTEDPAQIDAWILDHNDDDRIKGEVLYAPFFPRPIPTESTSFGELKSRFQH